MSRKKVFASFHNFNWVIIVSNNSFITIVIHSWGEIEGLGPMSVTNNILTFFLPWKYSIPTHNIITCN